MSNCCLNSVPHFDSRVETFSAPVSDWAARLTAGSSRSVQASDQTMGDLDEQMRQAEDLAQVLPLPEQAFTLVIELDDWNIRERDQWGQSAQFRAAGREPQRWHWVYGGTCFRLEQRVKSDGGGRGS